MNHARRWHRAGSLIAGLCSFSLCLLLVGKGVLVSRIAASEETAPRWEHEFFQRLYGLQGEEPSPELLLRIANDATSIPEEDAVPIKTAPLRQLSTVTPWLCIGPYHNRVAYGTPGRYYTGRILDIENVPGYALRVCAASGGVWEQRFTYTPLTEHLPLQAVGAIYTDVSNPAHITVGTGEYGIRNGIGIWNTTDGGVNWSMAATSPTIPAIVWHIRHNARNPNLLYAATSHGFYRSTDRGSSWVRTLAMRTSDMAIDPIPDPATILVTVWDSANGGIYKSINGGTSFTRLAGPGAPVLNAGRGAIVQTPSAYYALFAKADQSDQSLLGLYKSTDAGATWQDKSPGNFIGKAGWYTMTLAASPADPNILLAGGLDLIRTSDGGDNWTTINVDMIHSDQHAITWLDGSRVYVGSDGGLFYSSDAGVTWSSGGNFFPITQFNAFDIAPTNALEIAGGTQDNGFLMTSDGGHTWLHMKSGDAGGFVIDPNDATHMFGVHGDYDIMIFNVFAFHRVRSYDTGVSWNWCDGTFFNAIDGAGGTQFNPQLRGDASNPMVIYCNSGPYVYKSTNFGDGWDKLNPGGALPSWVHDVHVERFDGTAYFSLDKITGNDRLKVWEGASLADRAGGLPDTMSVWRIASHPSQNLVFALMGGLGNAGRKLYKSRDHGITWALIPTATLPDVPLTDLVVHPLDTNKIYLGSANGCFKTRDGGAHWYRWNSGMPDANLIMDLRTIDSIAINGKFFIVASTYGRSIWKREVTDVDSLPFSLTGETIRSITPNIVIPHQTVATLDGGRLGITPDYGAHWTVQQLPTVHDLFSARIESLLTITVGRAGTLLRTTDAGKQWTAVALPTSADLFTLTRSPAGTWCAAGDSGTILRSTDAGVSWKRITGGINGAVRSIALPDSFAGWAVGYLNLPEGVREKAGAAKNTQSSQQRVLLNSTDGGLTWQTVPSMSIAGTLNAITFPDASNGFLVGDGGTMFKTTDGGGKWNALSLPTQQNLSACFFSNALFGWVAGNAGTLLQTTDGGSNWQAIELPGQMNVATLLALDNIVMAGGPGGVYSTSTPAVASVNRTLKNGWNMFSVPVGGSDMSAASVIPTASSAFFAYEGGYQTKDTLVLGEGYWVKVPVSGDASFAGSPVRGLTVEGRAGWNIIGSLSVPIATADVVTDPPGSVSSSWFDFSDGYSVADSLVPGRAYWVKLAQAGHVVLSADAASKQQPKSPAPSVKIPPSLDALSVLDADGTQQTLYYGDAVTSVANDRFFELPPSPPKGAVDLRFETQRFVECSTDRPRTIGILLSGFRFPVRLRWTENGPVRDEPAVLILDGRRVVLSGGGEVSLSRAPGRIELELAGHRSAAVPAQFALSQNYPNPFNPSTTIRFDLPVDGRVTISLYDITGREVRLLLDQAQAAGSHTLRVDGQNLPSGVYFYHMRAGHFTATMKMLLLK